MKNWLNSAKAFREAKKGAGAKETGFSVSKTVKVGIPDPLFERVKKEVLGRKYGLSLVLSGDALMRKLNRKYRGKDKPTNILSFPYSSSSGEIFLNPTGAGREAENFGMSAEKFLLYLFIHGLLHLKGYGHGSRMEKVEGNFLKKFSRP